MKGRLLVALVLALSVTLADFPGAIPPVAEASVTSNPQRISVAADGTQGNGDSRTSAISADGRHVAFSSASTNLVAGDTNGALDVFVRDVDAHATVRVSVKSDGSQATGGTAFSEYYVAVSGDGRFVAFESSQTDLVPSDTNGYSDIFVRDRDLDADGVFDESGAGNSSTVRVSVDSAGAQGNGASYFPTVSSDGRYVAFKSSSTNLVAGDLNNDADIFVRNRDTDQDGIFDEAGATSTSRVSVNTANGDPNGASTGPSVSSSGLYIAFESDATNLVSGDNNGTQDVFRRDGDAGSTVMVSKTASGQQGSLASSGAAVSANGRVVAFESSSTNFATPEGTGTDIFAWESGALETVTVAAGGGGQNNASGGASVSSTGRFIAFRSFASNLVAGDTNGQIDAFVRDRSAGTTARISVSSTGAQGDSGSSSPHISSSGRYIAFLSGATNLVTGDTNGKIDVFLYDRGTSIPIDRTYGSGTGLHGASPFTFWADPINTASGAFSNSITDLALPGIGLPFRLARSYTSLDTESGPLGVGWTHNFAAGLAIQADETAVFKAEDGQRISFGHDADGSYTPLSPGVRSTLAAVAGGFELTRKDQVRYLFDSQGRLTALKDRNDNAITLAYDGAGKLDTLTDSAGRVIDFAYDASNQLASVRLPDTRSVSYTYTSGHLASVTDVRGGVTSYVYEAGGRLEKIIDQDSKTIVRNVYGPGGRVTEQYDALGKKSTLAWEPSTQTATMTDARGGAWKDVYQNNILVKRIDPLGHATSFGWDDDLNLVAVTDPRGNTWEQEYDGAGNLTRRIPPAGLGFDAVYTYNTRNDLTGARDGRANTTTYAYDASGNLITLTAPGALATSFGRDPTGTGLLRSLTDARGKTTTFDHDASGNLTEVTPPLGFRTTMTYDAAGRMLSMVEPRGNVSGATPSDFTWSYGYDDADAVVSVTDPLGNATLLAYDAVGRISSRTDANSHTTSYAYDAAGALTSVSAPDATVTSYTYDDAGNLVARKDANLHETTYAYDEANRLTSRTSPIGQRWTYGYDVGGNLTSVVDASGNATPASGDGTTTFTYDALNRLSSIDYSDATPDVTLTYDANGNRTQMTDGAGSESRTYDALNRLTGVTRAAEVFAYAYDGAGNVTRRTYPDGTVMDYTFDDDGRPTRLTSGATTVDYSYDPAGHLTQAQPSNGTLEARAYDRAGRLTSVTSTKGTAGVALAQYTLDPIGNPTSMLTRDGLTTYGYDAMDRLTEACFAPGCTGAPDPFVRFAYDAIGNRLTQERITGTTTYTYNAADQLLAQTGPLGTVTSSYDANGNLASAGTRTFSYDLANRTTGIIDLVTGSLPPTHTYTYDGAGKRLTAIDSSLQGTQTTRFQWDINAGLPLLASERDATGALVRRYAYGAGPAFQATSAGTSFLHHDGLGSIVATTDSAGNLERSYSYDPFGGLRADTPQSPLSPRTPLGFAGQYQDATGLYHLRARQYSTSTGRFTAPDPLEAPVGAPYSSAYAYAQNRPTVLTDPSGLRPESGQGGAFSRWWDTYKVGFAVTPTWAKVADGAVIVVAVGVILYSLWAGGAGVAAVGGAGNSVARALTTSEQRAVRSLERRIAEHQAKLDAYRANPDAFDNLGILNRAPTPEIRESIINGRIRHLENEISTFKDQILKLLGGG